MKQYRKTWLLSFGMSILFFSCLIMAFVLFMRQDPNSQITQPPQNDTNQITEDRPQFANPDDNVGSVTFTEDRITELARNIYSLDGYLNNINVELNEDGGVVLSGNIKDSAKLCETYPELDRYKAVLSAIEDQNITVDCEITNEDGMASLSIEQISVAGITVDKAMISPFVEDADFARLFNVEYDSIDIMDGVLVFNDGVPDILDVEK